MQDPPALPAAPATIVDPVPRIEFEAPWRSSFRFTSEDEEPNPRWDFDPFDVLEDLSSLLARSERGDPEAAYALYQTARACDDKLQRRLIAEYSEALTQRCVELNRATPQQRLSWLMQASDAVVPTAPMRALFALERLPVSDPQRTALGLRVTEALEKAVTKEGRLEDVIALARAFSQGDPIAQDLRKAVAYYQIAAEALGGGNSYAANAADLRLSLRKTDLADIRQMQARIFRERQQALKDNPLPGVTPRAAD